MGRYDNLRVYDGSSWRQPTQVQYWNGSRYVTMGTNTGSEKNHLYVYNGSSQRRVTLERQDYTIPGEVYSYGTFKLTPKSNAGWNPHENHTQAHLFECDIMKTTNGAVNVFTSKNNNYQTCNFIITWRADGKLECTWTSWYHSSSKDPTVLVTDNAVGANQWVHLKISNPTGKVASAWKTTVTWNGVSKTVTNYNTWTVLNADNTVGDPNLRWKGTLTAKLARYQGSDDTSRPASWTVNMTSNPVKATAGTIEQSMTVANTSTTGTRWI